jgi:hypothetical protein
MRDFFVILVRTTIADNGTKTNVLVDYLNLAQPITDPMGLAQSDNVAWYVQVFYSNNQTPFAFPYELSFFDRDATTPNSSFFGRSTLLVPNGGLSPFLQVLPLRTIIKYSISVPGIGTILDPEMQTSGGGGTIKHGKFVLPVAYTATWNIDTNAMSYQAGTADPVPFPPPPASLPVNVGDTIAFDAVCATATPIQILFEQDRAHHRLWASPFFFDSDGGKEPQDAPANPPIGPLTVLDDVDRSGTLFTFAAHTAGPVSNRFTFQVNH